MKVREETKKAESNLKPESLTDLPVADEQAENNKGGDLKERIQIESWSWGATNSGSY